MPLLALVHGAQHPQSSASAFKALASNVSEDRTLVTNKAVAKI